MDHVLVRRRCRGASEVPTCWASTARCNMLVAIMMNATVNFILRTKISAGRADRVSETVRIYVAMIENRTVLYLCSTRTLVPASHIHHCRICKCHATPQYLQCHLRYRPRYPLMQGRAAPRIQQSAPSMHPASQIPPFHFKRALTRILLPKERDHPSLRPLSFQSYQYACGHPRIHAPTHPPSPIKPQSTHQPSLPHTNPGTIRRQIPTIIRIIIHTLPIHLVRTLQTTQRPTPYLLLLLRLLLLLTRTRTIGPECWITHRFRHEHALSSPEILGAD